MKHFKTGFIGCGNMASAIIKGMQKAGESGIFVYDKDETKVKAFEDVTACASINELVQAADIIFLCVKPNIIPDVLSGIKTAGKAFVSIAAGVTDKKLRSYLRVDARIMRIMPNTPLLRGKGAICIQTPNDFTPEESDYIIGIFQSLGIVEFVDGSLMDSVTGVSGSGPAYVYMFIDALAKAGVKNGLEPDLALRLSVQTFEGACAMIRETDDTPEQLIKNVCSPGGTTIEAMKVFEDNNTYKIVEQAVDACVEKSRELSK
ncbi:MAG: pyrroline-5-carboxylate reductase [Christensenella sp.]|uniref:pyrroline-5-carboxylate reductase n=1 Tax=Christensenella sp. TaxID=1935934 RepID=UPI002B20CFF9|nr:pyrroline-5-carboxylate reductase [Christensenella sp.]MEA5002187.1 pyrroline-5-carboxylate reductase [Christensenella sp.]